jgi:hypothetical protein
MISHSNPMHTHMQSRRSAGHGHWWRHAHMHAVLLAVHMVLCSGTFNATRGVRWALLCTLPRITIGTTNHPFTARAAVLCCRLPSGFVRSRDGTTRAGRPAGHVSSVRGIIVFFLRLARRSAGPAQAASYHCLWWQRLRPVPIGKLRTAGRWTSHKRVSAVPPLQPGHAICMLQQKQIHTKV